MSQFRPSGSFNLLPTAVKNIIIINVIFFLATLTFQSVYHLDLSEYLGLHFFASPAFKPWQFITYMFMHGGFAHIFFNMFSLWMFGGAVESYLGTKKFVVFYFFTGIGAALFNLAVDYWQFYHIQQAANAFLSSPSPISLSVFINSQHLYDYHNLISINKPILENWMQHPNNNPAMLEDVKTVVSTYSNNLSMNDERFAGVLVGASGAIFGVLMAFGFLFPESMIYVYFIIPIKAKYFVFIYGAIEFFLFKQNNPGDNVAHLAHLGGMLFGFILLWFWKKNNRTIY